MADGAIWDGLKALKKDNTGYDLRDLLIGSEGTLGIITAATLRLMPMPKDQRTAFVAVPSLDALLPLFRLAEDMSGAALTAFEFMSARVLSFVGQHARGVRLPFSAEHPWCVLIEISHPLEGGAASLMEPLLAEALARGLISEPLSQARSRRDETSGACARRHRKRKRAKAAASSTMFQCP
jgi:FAD/FMN-containing dehydrogenase